MCYGQTGAGKTYSISGYALVLNTLSHSFLRLYKISHSIYKFAEFQKIMRGGDLFLGHSITFFHSLQRQNNRDNHQLQYDF